MGSTLGRGELSRKLQANAGETSTSQDMSTAVEDTARRCGRKTRKSVRYCQITVPQGPVQLVQGSCGITREEESTYKEWAHKTTLEVA